MATWSITFGTYRPAFTNRQYDTLSDDGASLDDFVKSIRDDFLACNPQVLISHLRQDNFGDEVHFFRYDGNRWRRFLNIQCEG